jgi:hypothetical protein
MSWNDIIPAHLIDKEWKELGEQQERDKAEKYLVGKTIEDAIKAFKGSNCEYRIARDGEEYYCLTEDYVITRANLEVDNGIVSEVTWG